MRLNNRTAIVTGSGNGIGRATAILFAKEGANVIVAEIEEDTGNETVEMIKSDGGEATYINVDTSKIDSVERMVSNSVEKLSLIHI